jgi:hypothetical protein
MGEAEPAPNYQGKKPYLVKKDAFHTFIGSDFVKVPKAAVAR